MKIIVCLLLLAIPAAYALHLPQMALDAVIKTPPMPAPAQPAFELKIQPLQINGTTTLCMGGTPSGKPGDCRNERRGAPMANTPR